MDLDDDSSKSNTPAKSRGPEKAAGKPNAAGRSCVPKSDVKTDIYLTGRSRGPDKGAEAAKIKAALVSKLWLINFVFREKGSVSSHA